MYSHNNSKFYLEDNMKKKTTIMFSTAVITTLLSFNTPVQAASDPEIRATEYNMDVRLNPHKN